MKLGKWYTQSNVWMKMFHETVFFSHKFGLNPDGEDESLPIMYWNHIRIKKLLVHVLLLSEKSAVQNFFQR